MDLSKATFLGLQARERPRRRAQPRPHPAGRRPVQRRVRRRWRTTSRARWRMPHPYGRLQFGADLDLHFRTLIGTGCNPNVAAVVVICIEESWAKKVADGIAKTGKPVAYFGIEQHGDHDTIMRASKAAKEYVQWASELRREERPLKDLWVSTKCGESDTTSGCGANPTVGNAFDKLYPHGVTLVFGETTELTGGEHLVAARCRNDEVRKKFQFMFDRYQEVDRPPQDERPDGLAADQGQHRGRPHHHRGEGAGQHPEDRPQVHGRRRARQGRSADRPGPVVHGLVLGRGRDGDAVRGGGLRGASLPHRPGQRHRQPDPAGDQALAPTRARCAPCPSTSTSTSPACCARR